MRKLELATKIAKKTNLDERAARGMLNLVLDEISASLKKGQSVVLTGFGSFSVKKRKKRVIHNINTGQPLTVPAHKSAVFEVGEKLKRLVK